MKTTFRLWLVMGCLLVAAGHHSCKHSPEDIPPPTNNTLCDSANVTYPGTVYPIFSDYCTGCHSGQSPSGGLDLTKYEQVAFIAANGTLAGAVNHATGYEPMPPGSKLSDCGIALIQKWISDTTFIPGGTGIPCDPDTAYFQNDVLPLLQSRCGIAGCHDPVTASDGVILTSYSYVMQTGDVRPFQPTESDLYEVIADDDPDKRMPPPPASSLTQEQRELIYRWIAQGAVNNYCDNADCDTVNITFSQTIWPVIQNRCYGCHSGASPSGGISLTNHAEVKAAGAIAAGNPGSLYGSITASPGNSPMPKNGNLLSECTILQIQKWIQNGMPDN